MLCVDFCCYKKSSDLVVFVFPTIAFHSETKNNCIFWIFWQSTSKGSQNINPEQKLWTINLLFVFDWIFTSKNYNNNSQSKKKQEKNNEKDCLHDRIV